ncbi:MAG: hypothetical protein JXR83_05200 [Deltaproteobacteria bacterium]|nr:hypothetical protein [Deltaproteobacteria bacterium]
MRPTGALLCGATLAVLCAACAHRSARDEARYQTKPLCENAVRKSTFTKFRAGFGNEYSFNELEALTELEQKYIDYTAIEIDYPEESSEAAHQRFERSLARKAAALDDVVQSYEPFITAVNEEIVAMSLYRIGEAHEQFAIDIDNLRVPSGLDEQQKDQFCSALAKRSQPIWEAARAAYKKCATMPGTAKSQWRLQCEKKAAQ